MRTKRALVLFSVALIAMMLFSSLVKADSVTTRYPPYAYGEMTTATGGYLASGYAKIYRAEMNRLTGKMYAYHSAQSVVYIAHNTAVNFYMGNTYPDQSVYAGKDDQLSITTRIWFKGGMRGYGSTGYARLTVKIVIINYQGSNVVYTVADYIAEDGITLYPATQYYNVKYAVPSNGYYAAYVIIYTKCYSGNSGAAWVDFGTGDNFIELAWIEYAIKTDYYYVPPSCPILSVYDGEEYVEEGILNLKSSIKIDEGNDNLAFHTLTVKPAPQKGAYLLRLTELDLPESHSYIDQVKLLALDRLGNLKSLRLISAVHSEYGNVLSELLFSDNTRTDTLARQTIDLKFLATTWVNEVEELIFVIEGYNSK